ncbi:MAG: tRNA 2-thiouridine(34) synthase MnmA [Steroidobacteraceae bacterium]
MVSHSPTVVALSGGVDSAVAALLLLREGAAVEGLYMQNWEDDDGYCTSAQDFQDARSVARELGIPLHRVDFSTDYRARVFQYFLDEYTAGRTPNPDVLCNREIKFGLCRAYAQRLGAKRFATGHYARLQDGSLHKGLDVNKDQSYFLHAVRRSQFDDVAFPIGDLPKSEVRGLARKAGLPVFDKPDSTGICFIGERPFREFLGQFLGEHAGPIETPAGEQVGAHRGLAFHTLGQRAGLAIGGRRGGESLAWYVAGKDGVRNALIVVQGHDHPGLQSVALQASGLNWLCEPPNASFEANVKLRYRQEDQAATILPRADGTIEINLHEPQRAVTPGQFVVMYRDTQCLGGGVIERTHTERF